MNRILAILLCLSLAAHNLARFSVTGLFALRKDFVAKNLCENRDRPELNCCGKCVLEKQLAKADEQSGDPKHSTRKGEPSEWAAVPEAISLRALSPLPAQRPRPYNPRLQQMYHSDPRQRVFRPPTI